MSTESIEHAEVAVTLIHHEGRVLVVWNSQWGGFTLPMTKRRAWQSMSGPDLVQAESWDDAAMRNVGECLGCTSTEVPQFVLEIPEYKPSRRSGEVKRYSFQVFAFHATGFELPRGVVGEWLTFDEILDEQRRPIAITARDLVGRCKDPALKFQP
jgi:hypothetical protein